MESPTDSDVARTGAVAADTEATVEQRRAWALLRMRYCAARACQDAAQSLPQASDRLAAFIAAAAELSGLSPEAEEALARGESEQIWTLPRVEAS